MTNIVPTYYSIRKVSEMLNIPASTLRYWEKEIDHVNPHKQGVTRFYTAEDIELLKKIQYLRSQNVPIEDIDQRLTIDIKGIDTRQKAIEQLTLIREELVQLRDMI